MPDPSPEMPHAAPRFGKRAVVLGLLGAILIAVATPINDALLGNTTFIGNFLPPVVILLILGTLGIQAMLHRLRPRWRLSGAELAVMTAIWLVSCAVPGAGLMKMLPTTLIGVLDSASQRGDVARLLQDDQLPRWLFPTLRDDDVARAGTDPVVVHFLGRVQPSQRNEWGMLGAVPWSAWATPALAWGALFGMIWLACICLAMIVRRQWAVNERLAFPLASVYSALIAEPESGRAFNATLRARPFWIAVALVGSLHLLNGLSTYTHGTVPAIPLGYDLRTTFTEGPLQYADGLFKSSTLYFSLIGITMFVQSRIVLSLWAFFVIRQVLMMFLRSYGMELVGTGDQVTGAMLAIAAVVLYVGRAHFLMVLSAMFGRGGPKDDPTPYAIAGWGLLLCTIGVIGWLSLAGMSVVWAVVLVLICWLTLLVMARVVAETGLLYATIGVWFVRPSFIAAEVGIAPGGRDFFVADTINHLTVPGLRESPAVFATHAVRIADDAGATTGRSRALALGAILLLAMLISYLASGASTLVLEYNYAATLSPDAPALNSAELGWAGALAERSARVSSSGALPPEGHSAILHTIIGAVIAIALGVLSLAFAWWPLHPVGYLLWQSVPIAHAWFSLFVGWLIKQLLVRFGGSAVFKASLPFFIGLIVGEILAAGFWSLVSLGLALSGSDYQMIRLLPS